MQIVCICSSCCHFHSVFSRVISHVAYPIERKWVLVQVSRLDHLLVCLLVGLSVRKLYCGKKDEWIQVLFGVAHGFGRETRV